MAVFRAFKALRPVKTEENSLPSKKKTAFGAL